jgi:PAS domain S-box-containing protein
MIWNFVSFKGSLKTMPTLESQNLLNLISKAYPGLVSYLDKDLKYCFANDHYLDWFGIEPNTLVGKSLHEVLSQESLAVKWRYLQEALSGKRVEFMALETHKKFGLRELSHVYSPDIAEDGTVRGFIIMAYDISAQRRAEKAAQDNEARFRSLTEVMPQLVWIADSRGGFIFFNQNWPRITNTNMEENFGHGWVKVLHHEDRVTALLKWDECIKSGNHYEVEFRIKMADGSYRWHITRGIPIRNTRGDIERWVGTTTDIQDQKNARELAVKEREKIYSLFMQAPVVLLVLTGPDHVVEMVNPAGRIFSGDRVQKGQSLKDCLPEFQDQGLIEIFDQIYSSGEGKNYPSHPIKFETPTGEVEKFYDLHLEPIKDENGLTTGILHMAFDVTEQIEKEKKLEDALKARDQFLSVASHELKTPLTSLKLQAQLTLRTLSLNRVIPQERQLSNAQQTSEFVGRLTKLIDDMLDVSRIRTGKLILDRSQNELGDLLREVIFRLSFLFEAAGLKVPVIDHDLKIYGQWDRFRIEQVIGNLITNGIRYGQGKPIEITIEESENSAIVSVTDQGYGISEADLQRIFGRFERAINSSEVSGLGLGLFISQEIVEAHGGQIRVKSELGKGSTFMVELPTTTSGEEEL